MWLAIDALNLRRDGRPKSVHEADDHRALADRGGAALDGSGTDVADGEDARDGRVEQPGSARLRAGENKPTSSRATASPSQSVRGCAPRNMNANFTGRRVPSLSVTPSRRPRSPCSSAISERSRTSTP